MAGISPLGKHNLDTSSIKKLAIDLSTRLCVNIEYGYIGYSEYFEMLEDPQPDNYIILGKILIDPNVKTYYLEEENYQEKQLYHKFGEEIFADKKFWWKYNFQDIPIHLIDITMNEILKPTFELKSKDENSFDWIDIHQDIYMNYMSYFSKWNPFMELFLKKDFYFKSTLNQLNKFRTVLMEYNKLFGGDKMYYLNNQSDIYQGIGNGDEFLFTWEEIDEILKDKCQDNILNIPLMLNDIEYQNLYLNSKKKIDCMIDDFSDLKI
ncbi:hypothetical protein [Algoriella sp.]|uniref:hypothetical protein n=1 Tax=Algoriella sp. TaxID=1872434 RepID=UPI002FCBB553